MSDSINDIERENKEIILNNLNPEKLAFDLRKKFRELQELKNYLENLGYTVIQEGKDYKIFKEL